MQRGGGGLLSFLLEKGSPGSESLGTSAESPLCCGSAATCPLPPAQPADQQPRSVFALGGLLWIALVTGVLGPVLSADEADYGDTEVMLGLKSANAYLSGCSAGGTGKPDPSSVSYYL